MPSLGVILLSALLSSDDVPLVEESRFHTVERLDLTVVQASFELPYGTWEVEPVEGLADLQLRVLNASELEKRGSRQQSFEIRRELRRGLGADNLRVPIERYAQAHQGLGPADWDALEEYLRASDENDRWLTRVQATRRDGKVALVPSVRIGDVGDRPDGSFELRPVLLELEPAVDDGRHWVLLNNGLSERRAVDLELLNSMGLGLRPRRDQPRTATVAMQIELSARLAGPPPATVDVLLVDRDSGRRVSRRWPIEAAEEAGSRVLQSWAWARAQRWQQNDLEGVSTLHALWRTRLKELYDIELPEPRRARRGRAVPGLFSLMGGQPAMRETLQMELLRGADVVPDGPRNIPIEQVAELGVASHPFEEMLDGRQPVPVELANAVPMDRCFFHLRRPAALSDFLGAGAPALSELLSLVLGDGTEYDLQDRYTAELGLSAELMHGMLGGDALSEVALFVPDLFFVDGTELTVIARLGPAHGLDGMLSLAGLGAGDATEMVEVPTRLDTTAYWARRGELLFLSTSRVELARSLALHDRGGERSLGRSAEFAFMTACVPTRDTTEAQIYLSDAFLRRMTGPGLKVGQLRRARARLGMEAVVAARELRRADGHEPGSIAELVRQGYLDARWAGDDLVIGRDGRVRSQQWGPLHRMRPLSAWPVVAVSEQEREDYETYVAEYRQYWRQFYDPIAIRYDAVGEGEHELSTFILPLIDSSIYAELRELIPDDPDMAPLRVPQLEPAALATFSVQPPEMAWVSMLDGLDDFLEDFNPIDPAFLDLLGPQIHLAIHDDEPLVRLGPTDLFWQSQSTGMFDRGASIGFALGASILTRPCDVLVELGDPERVQEVLDGMELRRIDQDFLVVRSVRLDDGRRIFSLDFFGMLHWDFSVRVEGRYLVVSNHPWSYPCRVIGVKEGQLSGAALSFDVDAVNKGREGLLASFAQQQRRRCFASIAGLAPWLAAGAADVEEAARRSTTFLGHRPAIADAADLIWDGRTLSSRRYGRPGQSRQPAELPEEALETLRSIRELGVEVQLEEDGLHSVLRWRTTPR